jgi:hypothetical protein
MAGLDPAIHQSSQKGVFSKKMDCRVKPGNDGLMAGARTRARSRSRIWESRNVADDSPNTGTDIYRSRRYINRARPVRAFGVKLDW